MTNRFATIAAAAALSALFAGNAMAQLPASGEGPLFLDEAKAVSTVSRASVQQQAAAQHPISGDLDGTAVAQNGAGLTREAVRQQAIAQHPASGNFDGTTVAQQYRGVKTQAVGE